MTEKQAQLVRVLRALRKWTRPFKTSLWWRLESTRVQLISELSPEEVAAATKEAAS